MRIGPLPWDSSAHWQPPPPTCRPTGLQARFGRDPPSTTRHPQWRISSLPAPAESSHASNQCRQGRQLQVPREDHQGFPRQRQVKLMKKGNGEDHPLQRIRKGRSTMRSQHQLQRGGSYHQRKSRLADHPQKLNLHQSLHQRRLEVLRRQEVSSTRPLSCC